MLLYASDYDTKMKNSEQDRIFSYDKPNKYRSDISNIIYCLLHNPRILTAKGELPEIIERLFVREKVSLALADNCVQKYANDIINRNEVYIC